VDKSSLESDFLKLFNSRDIDPEEFKKMLTQFKYWGVSSAYDDVTLLDFITTISAHDSALFSVNTYDVPIGSLVMHHVRRGNTVGMPKLEVEGRNLYLDKRFERLLGMACLSKIASSEVSSLQANVQALIEKYKTSASNQFVKPTISYALNAMISVIDTVGAFRSNLRDILDESEMLSHKYTAYKTDNKGNIKALNTGILNVETVDLWKDFHAKMIEAISSLNVSETHAAYMFQPGRLASLPRIFKFDTSELNHVLLTQPWYDFSGGKIAMRTPTHEFIGGKAIFGS
jgi:hypothetical protein